MNIDLYSYGVFFLVWLLVSVPVLIYLAKKKVVNTALTIFWGVIAILFPIAGLIFIVALAMKDDLTDEKRGVIST